MTLQDVADRLDKALRRAELLPDGPDKQALLMGLELTHQTLVDVSTELTATLDSLTKQTRDMSALLEAL